MIVEAGKHQASTEDCEETANEMQATRTPGIESDRKHGQEFRTGLIVGAVSFLGLTVIAAAVFWGLLIHTASGGSGGQAEIRRFRAVPELLISLVHGSTEQDLNHSATLDMAVDRPVLPQVKLVTTTDVRNNFVGAEAFSQSDADAGNSLLVPVS